ncbi:MAG: pyruvate formate lyase family protein [Dehalococcoidia bacterium]
MKIGTDTDALLSDRVKRLKNSLLTRQVRLSCERVRFLLDAWRESEGHPAIIRSARVLDKYLRGMTLYIDENPIVGSLTKYRYGCQPYPEWACAAFQDPNQVSGGGTIVVDPTDAPLIKEAVDYFSTRCLNYQTLQAAARRHPEVNIDAIRNALLWIEQPCWEPMGGTNVDFGKVLNIGLEGVIEEAKAELAKLYPGYLSDFRRTHFLEAVIIVCEAVIAWAERYAELAAGMATKETDPQRKQELEEIARICRRVPAKPATSLHEAIQSLWFVHLATTMEAHQIGFSPGRFCQYMYPFYKMSKEQGQISREQAIELLELLFIKFSEVQRHTRATYFNGTQLHQGQNVNIGGLTPEGDDATNEVDFLVVEAYKRIRLIQPSLTLLWHNKLSPEFLNAVMDLVKTGLGQPAFINCDVSILRLMNSHGMSGMSLQEARAFNVIACVDAVASHATDNVWEMAINMPKLLELTLNNGKDPRTGAQIGLQTGEAQDLSTYEELHHALRKQLQYFLPLFREINLTGMNTATEMHPMPFTSALIDDCIKRGKALLDGGARYTTGDGACPVGMIDLANSMVALKKLVFEEKKLTMPQLLDALRANFKDDGHQDVQRLLIQAPKYGNDDKYADSIAKEWYDIFCEEHNKIKTHLGEDCIMPYALSVSLHFMYGAVVGALPSGRKAFIALTDGSISAYPGTDRTGPTALLNSAVRVLDPQKYATTLLNMKFHPTVLETREGVAKFLNMITTYMNMGGYHIQFNILDSKTLREAQRHPEDYRGLVVRVAGYSAFFTGLSPEMQEEVIKRTEYSSC